MFILAVAGGATWVSIPSVGTGLHWNQQGATVQWAADMGGTTGQDDPGDICMNYNIKESDITTKRVK